MGKSGQKNAAAARTPEKRLRAIGGQDVSSGRKGPHRDAKPYRRSSAAGSVRKRPSPASRLPCRPPAQARNNRPAARSRPHPTIQAAPARGGRNTRAEAGQRPKPKKGRSLYPKTSRRPARARPAAAFCGEIPFVRDSGHAAYIERHESAMHALESVLNYHEFILFSRLVSAFKQKNAK